MRIAIFVLLFVAVVFAALGFYLGLESAQQFQNDEGMAKILAGIGATTSILSPVLALVGLILSGVDISRSSARGDTTAFGWTGFALNLLVFLPAIGCAVFCGGCQLMMQGVDKNDIQVDSSDGGVRYNQQWPDPLSPDEPPNPEEGPEIIPAPEESEESLDEKPELKENNKAKLENGREVSGDGAGATP